MTAAHRRNAALFAVICCAAVVVIAAIVLWARSTTQSMEGQAAAETVLEAEGERALRRSGASRLYFRYSGLDRHHGRLSYVEASAPAKTEFIEGLSCEAAYVAAGRGTCLSAARGVITTYTALLFETDTHTVYARTELAGVPSRTRVSPNGRYGATTVFVTGHGYDSVDFSTQTLLIDMENGGAIADLETFTVVRDGVAVQSADFNFWGVTFTPDSRSFYATLSTGGEHLLVRGDIELRRAVVVHEDVECPSLSPDGTRIVYKKRFMDGARIGWRLHVLDLASGTESPLPETRSVDDQLEWLDEEHVLYSAPPPGATTGTYVWILPVDGSDEPRVFARDAYSPSAVR